MVLTGPSSALRLRCSCRVSSSTSGAPLALFPLKPLLFSFSSQRPMTEDQAIRQDFNSQQGGTQSSQFPLDYREQLALVIQGGNTLSAASGSYSLYVDWMHLRDYSIGLSDLIEIEYYRFEPYLRKGIRYFAEKEFPEHMRYNEDEPEMGLRGREFWCHLYNLPITLRLRDLKTIKVGRLCALSGTVTRTSEVRPELIYGTFQCLDCNAEIRDLEQQFIFTQPDACPNAACQNRTRWQLRTQMSKFVDWQKVRVQENAHEIPSGAMPRSIDVILRHDAVEKAKAGDRSIFTGMLIVVPDLKAIKLPGASVTAYRDEGEGGFANQRGVSGLKELGVRELTYKLVFLASSVRSSEARIGAINIRDTSDMDSSMVDAVSEFTPEERAEMVRMKYDPNLYQNLVRSMAPTVFGHEEVKRGLLLQMCGGVHKSTPEGISLRGDINVLIVGDPSTAKSQFLKYVSALVPRAVYTSGKASSAAGLTASVVRDPDTGEFAFEAGALMLADNGLCCIDEFDKMDLVDQVAIHEAMEQQTISIAKAGIQATLNARASILAAANPIGGRYDRSKSLKANLMISAPIMSRFDLLFVVLDENSPQIDTQLARHIVGVHQRKDEAIAPPFKSDALQRYLRFAKTLKPILSPEAQQLLTDEYVKLRTADSVGRRKQSYRITVRQLEAVIRLSEALARLHLDEEVTVAYVREAARLLRKSIIFIESEDITLEQEVPQGTLRQQLADALDDLVGEALQGDSDQGKEKESEQREGTQDTVPMEGVEGEAPATESRGTKRKAEADVEAEAGEAPPAKKSKTEEKPKKVKGKKETISLTYEEYQRITSVLVVHLQQLKARDPDFTGTSQKELIDWFVLNHSNVASEEDLAAEHKKVRAVVVRLVDKEHVLITEDIDRAADERRLLAHPNYSLI